MGHDISKDITPPPLTLQDCLVDGHMNLPCYFYYRRCMDYHSDNRDRISIRYRKKRKFKEDVGVMNIKKNIIRTVKRHKLMVRDSDGSLRELCSKDTLWYLLYVANPPTSKRMSKLF